MEISRIFMHVPHIDDIVSANDPRTKGTEAPESDANTISSLVCPGIHAPVLDIDFEARLIPSSTLGHYHLYLDKAITWKKYRKLLKALAKAEIIEPGYARSSIWRGYSAVRKPGVLKKVAPPLHTQTKNPPPDPF
jgi:hypothetical protein